MVAWRKDAGNWKDSCMLAEDKQRHSLQGILFIAGCFLGDEVFYGCLPARALLAFAWRRSQQHFIIRYVYVFFSLAHIFQNASEKIYQWRQDKMENSGENQGWVQCHDLVWENKRYIISLYWITVFVFLKWILSSTLFHWESRTGEQVQSFGIFFTKTIKNGMENKDGNKKIKEIFI